MNTSDGKHSSDRIEFLKLKERELRARIFAERVRQQKQREKDTARLCSIIGTALVQNAAKHPDFELMLKGVLQTTASFSDSEKKLLKARGWL